MTAAEVLAWFKAKELLAGRNVSVVEAVEAYVRDRTFVREHRTLSDAVNEYLAARQGEGVGTGYLRHVKKVLGDFRDAFNDRDRLEVTPEEARDWLYGLDVAPLTQVNYRKKLAAFYQFCVQHQWVQDSPWRVVKPPKVVAKEIETLTVDQTRFLFRANEDQPPQVLARLALEAFAGLRYSSAIRLSFDDVRWEQKGVLLPAAKIKTERRQFIDGLPENLWAWLELCRSRGEDWRISERNYLYHKTSAFSRATLLYRQEHSEDDPEGLIPHPKNALRHSFATYHCAMHKSPGRTAAILCHRNETKLWQHYKGAATEAQGRDYFSILPSS